MNPNRRFHPDIGTTTATARTASPTKTNHRGVAHYGKTAPARGGTGEVSTFAV